MAKGAGLKVVTLSVDPGARVPGDERKSCGSECLPASEFARAGRYGQCLRRFEGCMLPFVFGVRAGPEIPTPRIN